MFAVPFTWVALVADPIRTPITILRVSVSRDLAVAAALPWLLRIYRGSVLDHPQRLAYHVSDESISQWRQYFNRLT
jgi:hypothetical protein